MSDHEESWAEFFTDPELAALSLPCLDELGESYLISDAMSGGEFYESEKGLVQESRFLHVHQNDIGDEDDFALDDLAPIKGIMDWVADHGVDDLSCEELLRVAVHLHHPEVNFPAAHRRRKWKSQ